jgi:hypothetical protein
MIALPAQGAAADAGCTKKTPPSSSPYDHRKRCPVSLVASFLETQHPADYALLPVPIHVGEANANNPICTVVRALQRTARLDLTRLYPHAGHVEFRSPNEHETRSGPIVACLMQHVEDDDRFEGLIHGQMMGIRSVVNVRTFPPQH